jgi:hypothetical protein
MDDLLSGAAKIDGRTLADLLDYFVQMSRHINYYDLRMNVQDWQPFFKNSVPFSLASVIRFPLQNTETSLNLYKCIFDRRPSPAGLQLLVFSIYYRFINNINNWHLTLQSSSLPFVSTIESLIKNKLQEPVQQFIGFTNAAVKKYGISRIDFLKLSENPVWGLSTTTINATDTSFSAGTPSAHHRILNLYNDLFSLLTVFEDAIKTLSTAAEKNLEQSFIPLKEELQKKHSPHLALLFVFLNMFRQLQNDLNQYTRKHLDYFYKNILQFQSGAATPDNANIVFEIQKALKSYLLKKGLHVKDGKDDNSQDIIFSLDDDIIVTQTKIADKRTLFINNQLAHAQTYVEGVYMAPVADMADGVDKPFADDPKNFFTLGGHNSKYIDPETKLVKPYPNARLGFILASPVLLFQAGCTRTVEINLPCELRESICADPESTISAGSKNCCDEGSAISTKEITGYPVFYKSSKFYKYVNDVLKADYWYISEDILKEAQKKGMSAKLADKIRNEFLIEITEKQCYCPVEKRYYEKTAALDDYNKAMLALTDREKLIFDDLIKPRKAFNFLFSGEKGWLEPSTIETLEIVPSPGLPIPDAFGYPFTLHIVLILNPDKGAVTFYDTTVFPEDFGVSDPLVKIELDDKIKFPDIKLADLADPAETSLDCCKKEKDCCLLIDEKEGNVSLYHFFRNVKIAKVPVPVEPDPPLQIITVKVCGLKNFIVQNDESLMDVNSLVYPFGARPKINSNFYIGSEEIFLKRWTNIYININWKDKPDDFTVYYNGYQDYYINSGLQDHVVIGNDFRMQLSILQDGNWNLWRHDEKCGTEPPPDPDTLLFQIYVKPSICDAESFTHQFSINRTLDFSTDLDSPKEEIEFMAYKRFDVNTRHSFIKITLRCQDFQHDKYPFVLARQMAALGKLPEVVDGAVYLGVASSLPATVLDIPTILKEVFEKSQLSMTPDVLADLKDLINRINTLAGSSPGGNITNAIWNDLFISTDPITHLPPQPLSHSPFTPGADAYLHSDYFAQLSDIIGWLRNTGAIVKAIKDFSVVIPKEPWTPTISNMAIDYTAFAEINDIKLVHLYPFAGTHKNEEIESQPALFPTFCDEGTLFLGLQGVVPGDNLNILFQLAEATSDSESDPETVNWYYLDSNTWKPLRTGFEVLDDGTKNLTCSGIIKFALPANMTNSNTVMPTGMHWIKAAIPQNSGSVSETTGILTQAIQVIFTNDDANDKLRLAKPLTAGSISKLEEADASVKSVSQPYDSFGGLVPEIQQQFYVRVSETLRHKGRAIQAFDYERLVLQAFPQLFKVKCINHSFALNAHEYKNDFPYAPGYVLLAVIPDLNQLKAGNSFEPKVPVSIIEDIDAYIRKRTSPFVRFRATNPRYEKINFCLRIRLVKGKDENYYKEKLKEDISGFLAPWSVGEFSKLTFGQCIYRSDIIVFLETRDYVDYIGDLQMGRDGVAPSQDIPKVCPATPRSILIAGNIEVCINPPDCETWGTYFACDDQIPVLPCNTKVEKIIDYCKKTEQ